MVNLELLDALKCCPNGRPLFKRLFNERTVTIAEAFQKMPKSDVIWFVRKLIGINALPQYIADEIPVSYASYRRTPVVLYLNKNYKTFIKAIIEKKESNLLYPLI